MSSVLKKVFGAALSSACAPAFSSVVFAIGIGILLQTADKISLPQDVLEGKKLLKGRYSFCKIVGRGGCCLVILARDTTLNSDVILKICLPTMDPQSKDLALDLLLSEAKIMKEMSSKTDGIPKIHDFFFEHGYLFVVMDVIEGYDLLSEEAGKWDEESIVKCMKQVLVTLKILHEQKVYHRDIKPQNIMYDKEKKKYMLIDFGMAVCSKDVIFPMGGTPLYMAPETVLGNGCASAKSDIYSLGVTALTLFAGTEKVLEKLLKGTNIRKQIVDLENEGAITEGFSELLLGMVSESIIHRYDTAKTIEELNKL